MKKTLKIYPETHQELDILRAKKGHRSFDETLRFLLREYNDNLKTSDKK